MGKWELSQHFCFPVSHNTDITERVDPASYFPSYLLGSRGARSSALPALPSCSYDSSRCSWGEAFPLWLDGGLQLTEAPKPSSGVEGVAKASPTAFWDGRASSLQQCLCPSMPHQPGCNAAHCREEGWGLKMHGMSAGDAPGCQTPSPISAWSTGWPALTDMSYTCLHLAWHWLCWLSIPRPSSAMRWVSGSTPQYPSWEWEVEYVCVQSSSCTHVQAHTNAHEHTDV